MYPNGNKAVVEGNTGLYLRGTNAEETTFSVRYQFGLKNNNDQKIQYFYSGLKRNGRELKFGFGYPKFLSHAALFDASKNYVVDGKLTIACKVI